jgi:hypothetical protein
MMPKPTSRDRDENLVPPGVIEVSPAALELARGFTETVDGISPGRWIAVFDWAMHIELRPGPGQPVEDLGACLTLSAAERKDIPIPFRHVVDGFEFAVEIPKEVWEAAPRRLIDYDDAVPFKLVLR